MLVAFPCPLVQNWGVTDCSRLFFLNNPGKTFCVRYIREYVLVQARTFDMGGAIFLSSVALFSHNTVTQKNVYFEKSYGTIKIGIEIFAGFFEEIFSVFPK